MNDNITFGFSRDSARVATIFRIAGSKVGTVVNGLGTSIFSSTVEVFAKVPAYLAATAASALNAAQRGITLSPNLLLLVSDLRDLYDANDPSRSLPAPELTYSNVGRAEEELARRRAAGPPGRRLETQPPHQPTKQTHHDNEPILQRPPGQQGHPLRDRVPARSRTVPGR